ncbi:hypothetical protein BBW68_13210 [Candidatus Erwinia dacicola]|uniref:Uncharacterized protein n=1 Tax=Candidatus Erwinia dacicola TaxID=252393 RepID=A0A1E7YXJ4_9GAMM|nr:hypothetical protein BBW68_13210 [Candidatus Erwinia dacicola]
MAGSIGGALYRKPIQKKDARMKSIKLSNFTTIQIQPVSPNAGICIPIGNIESMLVAARAVNAGRG